MSNNISQLVIAWLEAKKSEAFAVESRRIVEDKLSEALGILETDDGAKTIDTECGHRIKITCRIDRKIDPDLLAKLGQENGVPAPVWQGLVRWKADTNTKALKELPEQFKAALSGAITAKAGRPSYQITNTTEK